MMTRERKRVHARFRPPDGQPAPHLNRIPQFLHPYSLCSRFFRRRRKRLAAARFPWRNRFRPPVTIPSVCGVNKVGWDEPLLPDGLETAPSIYDNRVGIQEKG
jgi:hypothetical protein